MKNHSSQLSLDFSIRAGIHASSIANAAAKAQYVAAREASALAVSEAIAEVDEAAAAFATLEAEHRKNEDELDAMLVVIGRSKKSVVAPKFLAKCDGPGADGAGCPVVFRHYRNAYAEIEVTARVSKYFCESCNDIMWAAAA